ncbi:MAG TPA: hypothetical protein VI564_03265 [Candidatus Nanoarchaeia archaeon]|nr:hypothetical protein [Candidatus Nanoarchaeia archaeon]
MDFFEKEKQDFLSKKDKSKKGSIDDGIIGLINLINSKSDYYTTSSCAGRIVLLDNSSKKKNEKEWVLKKHSKVSAEEVTGLIENYNGELWLKQEPVIIHIRCKSLDAARKLLDRTRNLFKRVSIISATDKKIIVEIIGNERIDNLLCKNGISPPKDFIALLVEAANLNFDLNRKKTEKLQKELFDF